MPTQPENGWNAGDSYETFMGRWSRPLAARFVAWLDAPAGGHWLDVGTGTGALAGAICAHAAPASVTACDPSAPFVEVARRTLSDPRVTFVVAGTGSLPRRASGYDAVVSGLALNFFPDPRAAIEEQLDCVRAGGQVGAFVWDYARGMEFLRVFWDAAAIVEPRAVEVDEGRRFPICHPERLAALFREAGASGVSQGELSVATIFDGFDDYWRPFLGGTGPAPSLVASLSETQRSALVVELKRRLGADGDGRIALRARAWAVAGIRG